MSSDSFDFLNKQLECLYSESTIGYKSDLKFKKKPKGTRQSLHNVDKFSSLQNTVGLKQVKKCEELNSGDQEQALTFQKESQKHARIKARLNSKPMESVHSDFEFTDRKEYIDKEKESIDKILHSSQKEGQGQKENLKSNFYSAEQKRNEDQRSSQNLFHRSMKFSINKKSYSKRQFDVSRNSHLSDGVEVSEYLKRVCQELSLSNSNGLTADISGTQVLNCQFSRKNLPNSLSLGQSTSRHLIKQKTDVSVENNDLNKGNIVETPDCKVIKQQCDKEWRTLPRSIPLSPCDKSKHTILRNIDTNKHSSILREPDLKYERQRREERSCSIERKPNRSGKRHKGHLTREPLIHINKNSAKTKSQHHRVKNTKSSKCYSTRPFHHRKKHSVDKHVSRSHPRSSKESRFFENKSSQQSYNYRHRPKSKNKIYYNAAEQHNQPKDDNKSSKPDSKETKRKHFNCESKRQRHKLVRPNEKDSKPKASKGLNQFKGSGVSKLSNSQFSNLDKNNSSSFDMKYKNYRPDRYRKTRGAVKIQDQQQKRVKELTSMEEIVQEQILEKHLTNTGIEDNAYDFLHVLDDKMNSTFVENVLPKTQATEWSNGERQYNMVNINQSEQVFHGGGIWKSIIQEKSYNKD